MRRHGHITTSGVHYFSNNFNSLESQSHIETLFRWFVSFDMFLRKPVSTTEYKNKKRLGYCDFLSHNSDFFFSELWDINAQLRVIKSELCDINSQLRVIKSELCDINSQLRVIKSELCDINLQLPKKKNLNCEIKGRNYLIYLYLYILPYI